MVGKAIKQERTFSIAPKYSKPTSVFQEQLLQLKSDYCWLVWSQLIC